MFFLLPSICILKIRYYTLEREIVEIHIDQKYEKLFKGNIKPLFKDEYLKYSSMPKTYDSSDRIVDYIGYDYKKFCNKVKLSV